MTGPARWLFTLAIFAGSFLLFLVQPMVARMALPGLGGAPAVWNSALVVYQALLLAGYAYAHLLTRLPATMQGAAHLGVLALGALSLPIGLAEGVFERPGMEVLRVPWLFLLTVGPAYFALSAQAPLVQRWFAAHPDAGNPYPLYAASNLGSFAGLLAYPLLAEPLLTLSRQSQAWSAGYGVVAVLTGLLVVNRRRASGAGASGAAAADERPDDVPPADWRTIGLWLALSAVPSGLMMSTTTFLTTDIMAMPLLWVIPLGLYLLSFTIAFAQGRALASVIVFLAPVVLLVDGALSMFAADRADLLAAIASVMMLFAAATALHARLYHLRPPPAELTRFYLVTAAGGAIGGVFTALVAPALFDWTWEHPLLILAAALLIPLGAWAGLMRRILGSEVRARIALGGILSLVFALSLALFGGASDNGDLTLGHWLMLAGILLLALVLASRRWAFTGGMAALLVALGGIGQAETTLAGTRERSYFGVYSVREDAGGTRTLMHGTTIHGIQRSGAGAEQPISYYGPTSGVGQVLHLAPALFGAQARIGVVGLGAGTLACYRQPGQDWTFFEIDPTVLAFSEKRIFTFLGRCAPRARVRIGDARVTLGSLPARRFDLLAVDAFSSDAIPLHLLTAEALAVYRRALSDKGVLVVHISNRYVRLEPVLSRLARDAGMAALVLDDDGAQDEDIYASSWVALANEPERLALLAETGDWRALVPPEGRAWTDDYASILPYLVWENFL
ncbi:fused MFS/spermidine synthase [Aurantiacibacter spongiae]|uniref:Spermidine synthase n=1 Tax=Aurantiacibacter spongiae TaxID=2488860 RepID=A0A3N5CV82_9SPHN|nr:fused MFS/spermidine synthase [Aurantiacibacter spongiae]RPF71370.1 hypothetical protein EG799_06910 [Aurantiacibacter spongiae]